MLRSGRVRLLLVLAVAVGAFSLEVPGALANTTGTVTQVTDGPSWTGTTDTFTSEMGNITLTGSRRYVSVRMGDSRGRDYSIDITAPRGREFTVGVYDRAVDWMDSFGGFAGLSLSGDGRGCSFATGRFEIQDIAFDAGEMPTRLKMVYEHSCDGTAAATFGEVRVGYPEDAGPDAVPTLVRWPLLEPREDGAVVPVMVRAPRGLDVASVAVLGPDAAMMPLRLDECTGRRLTAGLPCRVFVRFAPVMSGTRTALLRVAGTRGEQVDVRLQGFSHGGRTRLVMRRGAGDVVGAARMWDYTPATALFAAGGDRQKVAFSLIGSDDRRWTGAFRAAPGDILAAGSYDGASGDSSSLNPGIEISGDAGGCSRSGGDFTITEATFGPDGLLRTFGADFEQRCYGDPAATLRGRLEHRAGDATPLPPWTALTGAPGPSVPVVPPSGPGLPFPAPGPYPWADDDVAPPAPPPVPAPPTASTPSLTPPPRASGGSTPAAAPAAPATVAPAGGPAPAPAPAPGPAAKGAPCTGGAWRQLGGRPDRFTGAAAADRIRSGGGNDVLRLGGGDDCAEGGAGADRLDGGAGADVLAGGSGADVLLGGTGDDALDGGPGRDRLDCGAGRGDVARVGPGDRVTNCERIIRTRVR